MRVFKALSLALCLIVMAACGGGGGSGGGGTVNPPGADTTAPTASITAPVTGTTVSGVVTIAADVSDNVGVTKAEFYVDGVLDGTDLTAPFSYNWYTQPVPRGSHILTVKAYDAANNSSTSSSTSVTLPLIAISMVTAVDPVSHTAVGTVSISGLASPDVYGLETELTMPAGGTTIDSLVLTGVATNAQLPPPPYTTFVNFGGGTGFGSGEVLKVYFGNVPAGALPADFGIALQTVFGEWGATLQVR